uniref:BED-type domain-containing protein n=1 Tax=Globisporangium ultimum (strain ATCC 200006 / CBS 805.95 / DAOM BR144) TaxID=431595 RepID=K3W7V4_GLOUD
MRRPELWQFIRLVVPDPPTVAAGKKYTNQDAKEAYCLKCKRMMHYNTGSSNNVSRHMAKFHPADLASYEMKMSEKKRQKALQQANNTHQQHSANANGDGSSNTGGRKRKLQRTDHHGSTAQSAPFQLIRHGDDGFSNAADVDASGHGVVADADTWSADSDDDTGGSKPMIEPATSTVVQAHGDASLLSKLHDPGPSSADAVVSSVVETEKLNTLIAKWVCKHYHPFGITEDPEFQAIINFAINMKKSVSLPLPPQSEVRASVESLSARTRLDILHQLTSEVLYFSIATEFWTTTERDVFISFSIHYLTEQFDWRHFTLDVREYNGHLSPEERKEQVDMLLTRWNLDPRCMNTILWDSYNPPPTENEFIPHHTQQTESVAHVIQCIISPIFHAQKELTMDDVPLFFVDEQINTLVSRIPAEFQHGVHFLREYVGVFRDLAWFLTNHPRAVVWMSKFMAGSAQIRLIVDSKSNWLTTVDMLRRLMRKKEVIRDFFAYIETSEGRLEFQHSGIFSRTLPGNEQWCAIECLLLLLQPFESVAVAINKEKYASSCLALALLRFLKRDLEKANDFARIFAIYAAENSDDDIQFKQKIAASIDVTRKFLHGRFLEHFDKISNEYMWISQLDPRFVRMKYLSDAERENCKTRLVERCLGLTNALQNQKCNTTTGGSTAMHESAASSSVFLDFQTNKDDNDTNIFLRELLFDDNNEEGTLPPQHHHHHHHHLHPNHHPPSQNDLQQQHNTNSAALATATSAEMTGMMHAGSDDINQPSFEEQQANLRQQIVAEVDLYYQSAAVARVPAVRDPLQWWRENAPRLPLLAPLARKWLAPVGSVRPTETLEIPSTGMATSLSLGGSGGAAPTHHHANGAAHHYVAVHCDPELVRDMVFVHDNC